MEKILLNILCWCLLVDQPMHILPWAIPYGIFVFCLLIFLYFYFFICIFVICLFVSVFFYLYFRNCIFVLLDVFDGWPADAYPALGDSNYFFAVLYFAVCIFVSFFGFCINGCVCWLTSRCISCLGRCPPQNHGSLSASLPSGYSYFWCTISYIRQRQIQRQIQRQRQRQRKIQQ